MVEESQRLAQLRERTFEALRVSKLSAEQHAGAPLLYAMGVVQNDLSGATPAELQDLLKDLQDEEAKALRDLPTTRTRLLVSYKLVRRVLEEALLESQQLLWEETFKRLYALIPQMNPITVQHGDLGPIREPVFFSNVAEHYYQVSWLSGTSGERVVASSAHGLPSGTLDPLSVTLPTLLGPQRLRA